MQRIFHAISLALLFLSSPAIAQVETVTVESGSLAGLWKIGVPTLENISWRMKVTFGPMRDLYCRLEGPRDNLQAFCMLYTTRRADVGDVSLEGDKIHIAWGNMMLRLTVDGTFQPDGGFIGNFTLKASGINIRAPEPSKASRIVPSPDAPDAGGKSAALAKFLTGVAAGEPLGSLAQLISGAEPPTASELRKLGPIQSMAHLGRMSLFVNEVYAVEFANGERLCGLHQRPDGVIDNLVCN